VKGIDMRIAINGFGRIGRSILRALCDRQDNHNIQIVAINELADLASMSYMFRYDSTYGRFSGSVESQKEGEEALIVNGQTIHVYHCAEPHILPWAEHDIDLVLECSGSAYSRDVAQKHLNQGAKRILISNPAQDDVDFTCIYGVNHHQLIQNHRIISNGSCSSNCLVPILKMIDDQYGIVSGMTTTIHSAMNDQPVIDAHHSDLRKTRAAAQSIIPIETSLPLGIERIMPHLKNKIESLHIRVPILNVSALDITLQIKESTTSKQVNDYLNQSIVKHYRGVLKTTNEPHASIDFNKDSHSGVVDMTQTRVAGGYLLKLFVWFDNEWGFANRMLDVAELIAYHDDNSHHTKHEKEV
jgi:D-erythrose 4-phosphate dehydrogenase